MNDLMTDPTRGALNETNDCAVRALAAATGLPYATAHAALARAGRPHRGGAYWRQVIAALDMLGISYTAPFGVPYTCSHVRIGRNTKQMARNPGRWIVSPSRHFTALVDGEYSDSIGVVRARPLTGALRIFP